MQDFTAFAVIRFGLPTPHCPRGGPVTLVCRLQDVENFDNRPQYSCQATSTHC